MALACILFYTYPIYCTSYFGHSQLPIGLPKVLSRLDLSRTCLRQRTLIFFLLLKKRHFQRTTFLPMTLQLKTKDALFEVALNCLLEGVTRFGDKNKGQLRLLSVRGFCVCQRVCVRVFMSGCVRVCGCVGEGGEENATSNSKVEFLFQTVCDNFTVI